MTQKHESNQQKFSWDEYGKLVLGIIDQLQHQVDEIRETFRKNFTYFLTTFIIVFFSCMGYLITDNKAMKKQITELTKEHESLRRDFGAILKATEADHIDALGFSEMVKKYYPARGKNDN